MKTLFKAAIAALLLSSAGHAKPVTFNFAGAENFFNEGLPGNGNWSGSMTIDPSAASANNSAFPGAIIDIYLNINGAIFQSVNECTNIDCNSFNPTVLFDGRDAFVANYEGDFESPTGQQITAAEVFLDIRTSVDLFSSPSAPWDTLVSGTTISLLDGLVVSDTYFLLSVAYNEEVGATDGSVMNGADLDALSLTVGMPASVPLPAGAPLLLAGLGLLGWMKRRQV